MEKKVSFLDVLNRYLESDQSVLPVFNRTAMMVQREVARDAPDVATIERLIISDQALTGQVLRTANSAFYKGMVKVTTVKSAIIRLGAAEIANIVMLSAQKDQYRVTTPELKEMMAQLWRHAVGVGIGAQWIAKKCGYLDLVQEAFTAGLLHDVGKLLLLTVLDRIQARRSQPIQGAAKLIMEIMANFHEPQGQRLLKQWNLPSVYANIAANHHNDQFNNSDTLLVIIRLADQACNKLGIGLDSNPDIIVGASGEAGALSLTEIDLAQLEIMLEDAKVLAS